MDQLWEQIAAFDFDQPVAEYGFTTRLGYENQWTVGFTADAILEYKKFMFLAATAGQMVSPSPIVDVVWHQHLIFTQSYFDFCQILGKKIEHIPSTHDPKQAAVFREAEQRTTKLYESVFGPQPAAFWKHKSMTDSIGLKPARFHKLKIIPIGIVVFLLLLYPACLLFRPPFIWIDGSTFIVVYAVMMALSFVLLKKYNDRFSDQLGQKLRTLPLIEKLTPSEVIFMENNSLYAVVHSHVNALVNDDTIDITDDKKLTIINPKTPKNNIDKAIIGEIDTIETVFYDKLIKRLIGKPVFKQVSQSAADISDYFSKTSIYAKYYAINYFVLLAMLLIGFTRLFIGISRDRPVGFLVLMLIVGIILTVRHMRIEGNFFTRQCIPDLFRNNILKETVHTDEQPQDWNYFLYGNAILATALLPLVTNANEKQSSHWSNGGGCGTSCGSSCGSSCGGGGCGGCGGD